MKDFAVSGSANNTAVTFFYFSHYSRHGTAELVRSLVQQLVTLQESLPDWITLLYDSHGKAAARVTLSEALDILHKFSEIYATIFIVIDALDECRDGDMDQTLKVFDDLIEKRGVFKILVTSRLTPITRQTKGRNYIDYIDVDYKHIQPDIERKVSYFLSTNSHLARILDDRLKSDIRETIVNRSYGR